MIIAPSFYHNMRRLSVGKIKLFDEKSGRYAWETIPTESIHAEWRT
jgi:hypothetical protein